ncbi:MAG: response regulator transcription factor [Gemmatimonadota bacterium]
MLSLLIGSPARLYRENLVSLFLEGDGFCVNDAVATWAEVTAVAAETQPSVALLDMSIVPEVACVRQIFDVAPSTKVIIAALFGLKEDIVPWLQSGVHGLVTCEASVEDVRRMVHAVSTGNVQFPADVMEWWLRKFRAEHDMACYPTSTWCADPNALTARELEVTALIAEGVSNKGLARHLGIAHGTVKNHVHHVLQKLNLQSRSQIAVWFVKVSEPENRGTAERKAGLQRKGL